MIIDNVKIFQNEDKYIVVLEGEESLNTFMRMYNEERFGKIKKIDSVIEPNEEITEPIIQNDISEILSNINSSVIDPEKISSKEKEELRRKIKNKFFLNDKNREKLINISEEKLQIFKQNISIIFDIENKSIKEMIENLLWTTTHLKVRGFC